MELTDGKPTPEIFRLWAGISAIAGALERRVWVDTAQSIVYPNLYILLVGPPASGKTQAIDPVADLWLSAKRFHTAPNSITSASLIDALAEADRKIIVPPPDMLIEYHALQVPASELGVLVNKHDMEFLSNLNYIYDNPKTYRQKRRHQNGGKELQIVHPMLNILAGTQPGFLASLLPDEAWHMGTMSRMIMIYAHQSPHRELFGALPPKGPIYDSLLKAMNVMADLRGQFQWEPQVAMEFEHWFKAKLPPIPTHSKLTYYSGRRVLHMLKLCMVAAISRSRLELVIRLADFERARDWMLSAEKFMPDIFRDMYGKSDHQLIEDLHLFLWGLWIKGGKKSLHESVLYSYLQLRCPVDKIPRIIEAALRADVLVREAGSIPMYYPKPKRNDYGVE